MTQEDWSRVFSAYEQASDLPQEEQAEFIRSTLVDDGHRARAFELLAKLNESEDGAPEEQPAEPPQPTVDHPAIGRGEFLGRFQVLEEIGRGGMGEVYRALDTDLGRHVAIKCIAGRRLGTGAAVGNFIREARLASALNHPGIVTIYEVIRTRDTVAIAMELAEGATLRKLCGTPQPAVRVATWGRQIAEALAASHAAGLIHRDIKPENLMLRHDGFVKLLDFGLARRHSETAEPDEHPVAGTLRYMSPEQGRGAEVGPATDIFSLGLVLYELAAGVHPFASQGGRSNSTMTVAEAIAASVAPPLASRNRRLPPRFTQLVDSMIAARPGDRPSAAEVAARLAEITAPRPAGRRLRYAAAGIAVLAALGAGGYLFRGERPPNAIRILPFTTYAGMASQPAFSPDGQRIAFTWSGPDGSNYDIYWQAIGETQPHRLTTDPAEDLNPVFSPDGRSIAFLRRTASDTAPQVVIVPAEGGPEQVVGRIAVLWGFRGLDWWPDGKSLLVRDVISLYPGIVRLYLDGHKTAFSFPTVSQADGMVTVSPDGTRAAFIRYYTGSAEICWELLAGGETHCVARPKNAGGIAWHPGSRAIYYSGESALWRVGLSGAPWDRPVKVADGIFGGIASDRTGRHLAFNRTVSDSNLWRIDRDGKPPVRLIASNGEDSDPSWSPDGRHIVIRSNRSGAFELYVYNADGTGERQVTHFGAHISSVRWSPDGQWLAFDGNRAPVDPTIHYHNIFVVPSAGGAFRKITEDKYNYTGPNWSPDGKWIYYTQLSRPFESRKAPLAGGPSTYVGDAMYDVTESSDGKYFYFTYETETGGIWRRPVAGGPDVLMKGTEGVHLYRYWDLTRDGLFFVNPAPKPTLRVLDLRTGHVEKIADLPSALLLGPRALAVSPDGRSIVYTLQDVMLGDIELIEDL